jgi:DAK2 domain fusion protein YloV
MDLTDATPTIYHRQTCDGHLFKWLTAAGHAWLEHNMERVNQLNVFPVPDGDTGTNMHLTMRKAYEEVSNLSDDNHVGRIAQAVARGALMGARGNSGVILSQLLAGFAESVKDLEVFDAKQMTAACDMAVQYAYKAVVNPVEGTILTVSREGVETLKAHMENEANIPLRDLLEVLVDASKESLQNTPDLLPVLKDAGVVDSGGMGYICIIEGMLRFLEGKPVKEFEGDAQQGSDAADWQNALEPDDEEGYGYDVQFLIHGNDLDVPQIRADIDAMGWSTLVVGDPKLVKVHVHVHNPAEPLNYAIATLGAEIDDIVVENMQMQYQGYVEQRVARESGVVNQVDGTAVVTVATGDGIHSVFKNDFMASYIIHGGQTMNPSTEDFVAAIDALPNSQIILLPNNKNIVMAAQQAAKIAEVNMNKQVRVVASRTIPQGIGAMMSYMNAGQDGEIDELAEEMREGLAHVHTVEITHATRDVTLDGVAVGEGQVIGIADGKLVEAGADLSEVIIATLKHVVTVDSELVTLYYGEGETEESSTALCDALQDAFTDLEFEAVPGGQALYPYLISIE